jgi:hypothetical protein
VVSVDSFRGHPAFKLIAEQNSSGYYGDRIRQPEWRRHESLTIVPAKGFAARFERIVEKRDPEAEELSFRSVLSLEQQGQMVYAGGLYQERREEAVHAAAFMAMLDRLLAAGGRAGPAPFEALAKRIATYMSDHGAYDTVPYREAVAAVRKRAESAAKGNLPPAPPETVATKTDPLAIGRLIPDITPTGISTATPVKLSSLRGKPVLLAYFQPSTSTARSVLKMANELHSRKLGTVLPLAIGDPAEAKKLHVEQKLSVPIYNGMDVYKRHGLEATPVFVVVDADGAVRHVTRGWGSETPAAVTREFERWVK